MKGDARAITGVHAIILYHGTVLQYLPSIAQKGLIPRGGLGWSPDKSIHDYVTKSVFLAADIARAARYSYHRADLDNGGLDGANGCILEVRISGAHRVHLLQYDQMDRHINDEWHWVDDDLRRVRGAIHEAVEALTGHKSSGYGMPLLRALQSPDDLENLDGTNIYKWLVPEIAYTVNSQPYPEVDRRAVVRAIRDAFSRLDFDFIEIKPDGTIKLMESFYGAAEQLYFQRGLPPATIKKVWVRSSRDPARAAFLAQHGTSQQKFGVKPIPGDVEADILSMRLVAQALQYSDAKWDSIPSVVDTLRQYGHNSLANGIHQAWEHGKDDELDITGTEDDDAGDNIRELMRTVIEICDEMEGDDLLAKAPEQWTALSLAHAIQYQHLVGSHIMGQTIRQAIWAAILAYKPEPHKTERHQPAPKRNKARKYYATHKRNISRTRKKWYAKVKRNPVFKRKRAQRRK